MTTRSTALLRLVHARPGITRADVARRLGFGTGAVTEVVARLGAAALLAEAPAERSGGRGRPTRVLLPHPEGPLIAAAEITHEAWRVQVVQLGGLVLATRRGTHDGRDPAEVIGTVAAAVGELQTAYAVRLRGLGLSVPGTVSPDLLLDASTLTWRNVDLHAAWPATVPAPEVLLAGNDANLAAAAESARGAAVDARVHLHLRIEAGLGGAVVDQGRILVGALGAAGEFGHMPFGDPAIACPCGARGCWGMTVDGTAMARALGEEAPRDSISYARRILASTGDAERHAVRLAAAALGRGLAGLVNGLDPDLITLGGLGADLLAAAAPELEDGYRAGLMTFRRASPPPVTAARLGAEGPIAGAAEEAWQALLPQLAG